MDGGVASDWSPTWTFNVSETGVGIAEQPRAVLSVYPNPVNDILNVIHQAGLTNIQLIDISGRTVVESAVRTSQNVQLSVSDLNTGVYFLKALTADGSYEVKQVVIE